MATVALEMMVVVVVVVVNVINQLWSVVGVCVGGGAKKRGGPKNSRLSLLSPTQVLAHCQLVRRSGITVGWCNTGARTASW